jgi:PAS domain S-box-containing protein
VSAALEGRVSPFRVLHRIKRGDGGIRWIEGIGQVIRDDSGKPIRMLGLVGDVTDREVSERQLLMEKETAQMYLDTAGVMMVVVDLGGTVELINRKGIEILGYTEDKIVGHNFAEFVPETSKPELEQIIVRVTGGEVSRLDYYEMPVMDKSGDERLIAWHSVAIKNDDGEIVGVLGSGSDITERRHAEQVKKELEDQLRHSQRMETIGTLAGGIAHDFNNILSPILGYTDMAMEDAGEDSTVHEYLEHVVRATHRAKELVEQILLFSKNVDQEASPIHLHLVIREGLKFVRASLPTTIEIQQNVNIDAGVVLANSAQIHQVLVNLCTNAAYAMRDSGGVLRVSLESADVTQEMANEHPPLRSGSHAKLTVSDTGRGMDPETAARIFEPFFTTKAVGEGTGLGLSVVHGIVTSHGGAIVVESKPGTGTTVTVYIPHTDKAVMEAEAEDVVITGTETVLLVDDEPDIVKLGERLLNRLGYRISTARSGEEALQMIGENPDGFDLVITDQTMPRLTGLKLIEEIRNIRQDLPIILTTGFSDMITPEKLEELNVSALVMKPLTGKKLGAAIRRVLDNNLQSGDE